MVVALILTFDACVGMASAAQPTGTNPRPVTVGVYINQIYGVNLKENEFKVDFYIWFRWGGQKDLTPLETFEIMNGRIESKSSFVDKDIYSQHYVSARILATINQLWDLRPYPFDKHTLELQIEDSQNDISQLVYLADKANSGASPSIHLSGWNVSKVEYNVELQTYETNYGDVSLPTGKQSVYSRFLYAVHLDRPGVAGVLKALSAVLISTFVAFLAFLIRPTNHEARFALGIGALFAVVASEIFVSSTLPESGVMMLVDKLHLSSIAVIFLTLFVSALSLRLYERGRVDLGERLDRACLAVFPIAYLLGFALLILLNLPARAPP